MLPETSDLVHAFLIPAAGAGLLGLRMGRSDDELREMLDQFRVELRVQFEADREREKITRAKLETLAAEWAPRVENSEIGVEISHMMMIGIVDPLALLVEERKRDRELLRKIQDEVLSAAGKGRPSVRPYAIGWVEDGRALADANMAKLETSLARAREIAAAFRSGNVSAFVRQSEDGVNASLEDQMAVGGRMMAKYRNALRELAK